MTTIEEHFHFLMFGVQRSLLYHKKRFDFLSLIRFWEINQHTFLLCRFLALAACMQDEKITTGSTLKLWTCIRLEIEKDEPPVLRVLDSVCHNELLLKMGYDPIKNRCEFVDIKWYQRLFMHIIDINASAIHKFADTA